MACRQGSGGPRGMVRTLTGSSCASLAVGIYCTVHLVHWWHSAVCRCCTGSSSVDVTNAQRDNSAAVFGKNLTDWGPRCFLSCAILAGEQLRHYSVCWGSARYMYCLNVSGEEVHNCRCCCACLQNPRYTFKAGGGGAVDRNDKGA